ncbi:MAG: hypothetical protein KDC48_13070 [Planctomycetes bacterium]|nr:hypothetical protein [Planctomycetota bacterium]
MAPPRLLRGLVLGGLLVATSIAQDPFGRGGRGGRPMPPSRLLQAIDTDGNGALSSDEIDFAARSLLQLDTDRDGNLSAAELTPARGGGFRGPGGPGMGGPGMGGPPGGMDPVLSALDKDGDGELFEDEITDAARSLDRLDRDGDDMLSEDELAPTMGGRGGFGPGGPGGFGGRGRGGQARYQGVPRPEELRAEDGTATIPDRATFDALSYQGEEVMIDTHLAGMQFVKFQLEGVGSDDPRLYFMNTKVYRAHPMFMGAIGLSEGGGFGRGGGSSGTMRGVLVYRPMLASPAGAPGLYTFEFEPNDAFPYDSIRIAFDQLQGHSDLLRGNLAYNLLPRAKQRWSTERERYVQGKLPVFDPEATPDDVAFLPLHRAVSFGRLRLMAPGERPSARDVVVYRALPNEMPRTAGVLTGVRQTPLSHVNLRAVQDDVPNAFVRDVAAAPAVQALLGKYVRYEVTDLGYSLREATAEEVEAHFVALRPQQTQVPPRDLDAREILPFDQLGFADAVRVGVKAANLAVLRGLAGAQDGVQSPDGYAVPFAFYDDFMRSNGFYEMARQMMQTGDFQRDAATRERALKKFRKAIEKGKMPAWADAALEAVRSRFPDGQPIRCRSSTNNEDLPGFSGAGLYDSFTHRAKEGHLAKTVRQVYASMWNFRAFEEREFYRVDHFAAAMGVVLHANSEDERLNGVAVTRDVLYQELHRDKLLYYVNVQVGDDLVTNPQAESVPEELLLSPRNPAGDRVMQRSNRAPAGQDSLLTVAQRLQLRRCLRALHEHFARCYGRVDDPTFAMEVEFKVSADGALLIKQARPWVE